MQLKQEYRHTLKIRNIYCFCTAKMVTRKCLNVTFIHTLPFLLRTAQQQYCDSKKTSRSYRLGGDNKRTARFSSFKARSMQAARTHTHTHDAHSGLFTLCVETNVKRQFAADRQHSAPPYLLQLAITSATKPVLQFLVWYVRGDQTVHRGSFFVCI